MVEKLKKWLKRKLFSTEEVEYQAKQLALKQMQESVNITALARAQLCGFDPKSITLDVVQNREALSIFDGLDSEEEEALVNNVHSLHANPALQIIIDFLTRSQVLHGHQDADSLGGLNFSRATINGFILLKEQIDTIEGLYAARHVAPDNYDVHDVV